MRTTTETTDLPRSQHWTVEGFRVSVLIYKTYAGRKCGICGQRIGLGHSVSADRKSDDYHGSALVCTPCRPARGTLPAITYQRYYADGPFWTGERLAPSAEWTCACDQPGRYWQRLVCEDCDDPKYKVTTTERVITLYGERTDVVTRHDQHNVLEYYECDDCHMPAAEALVVAE